MKDTVHLAQTSCFGSSGLDVIYISRDKIGLNKQPHVRFFQIWVQKGYCKSLLGFSNSVVYSIYSNRLDVSSGKVYIQNLDVDWTECRFEKTLPGVVLSRSKYLARCNLHRDCSLEPRSPVDFGGAN